jgi:Fuc2NAc and GlcNAc transferase
MILLAWAIGACLLTFGVGLLVAAYGVRAGFVDAPNGRSSHTVVTPLSGGIGIVIAGIGAAIARGLPVSAWLSMSGIGFLGLVDDRWHVEPRLRLIAQGLMAGLSTLWLLRQTSLPVMTVVVVAITLVLVLVGTTNAYNFMDGANGMAALMAVVVFGTIGTLALTIGEDIEIGRAAVITAAACCGLLPLNLRCRAMVFMGDVCSTFLGFTAAFMALQLWMEEPVLGVCALGAMTVFYVDSGLTLMVRLCRRERVFEAHRMHAYQRLVNELNWAHPVVALTYAGIQATISILLLVTSRWGYGAVAGALAAVVAALSLLYWSVQMRATRRA